MQFGVESGTSFPFEENNDCPVHTTRDQKIRVCFMTISSFNKFCGTDWLLTAAGTSTVTAACGDREVIAKAVP